MKNALIAVLVVLTATTACKKEETEKSTTEKVIGTWKGVENYYEETEPGQPTLVESEDLSAYNFNFKADGTLVMDSAGFDPETITWSVTTDDKMVWNYNAGGSFVFDISVLTDSKMHLDETGTYTNGNGEEVHYLESIRLKK